MSDTKKVQPPEKLARKKAKGGRAAAKKYPRPMDVVKREPKYYEIPSREAES